MNKNVILVVLSFLLVASPVYARKHKLSVIIQAIDSVLVKTPQDQEICFSPNEPCDIKLIKFIQMAQKSIDVAIYDINLDQFVHQLLVLSKRIPVRIIVDKRQGKSPHSLVPLLIKAGANIRYGHQRGIFHNKFTVVDNKMIETGSFNYTNHASEANNENQIYLTNPQIVEKFHKQFEDLWRQADPALK